VIVAEQAAVRERSVRERRASGVVLRVALLVDEPLEPALRNQVALLRSPRERADRLGRRLEASPLERDAVALARLLDAAITSGSSL
jgi:hypothetical protein